MPDTDLLSVVSVDVLALRRNGDGLHLGLVTRAAPPFEGANSLPGVVLRAGERLSDAAVRALARLTPKGAPHELRQLAVFDEPHRDPRGPALSIAMAAAFGSESEWPGVPVGEAGALAFDPEPGDAGTREGMNALAFDHGDIVRRCLPIVAELLFRDEAFTRRLLGAEFTTREASGVLEALTGEVPHRGNLARRIAASGAMQVGSAASTGGRPGAVWGWVAGSRDISAHRA